MDDDSVLAGCRALVLREPARAAGTVAALASRGASASVCRLIDFELPADTRGLDDSLRVLLAGGFDWLVLTSVNTVRALGLRAAALDLDLQIPETTRVAVVGEATALAVTELGAPIAFMPVHDHSARGMLAEWDELNGAAAPGTWAQDPQSVFMPQADIASATLRDGFAARGWATRIEVAYQTVPAPADPHRALRMTGATPDAGFRADTRLLAPAQLPAAMPGLHAVFFSSPSTVDAFLAAVPEPAADIALIAIGDSTAARLRAAGLLPTAVAGFPTPEGLVAAWEHSRRAAPHTPT